MYQIYHLKETMSLETTFRILDVDVHGEVYRRVAPKRTMKRRREITEAQEERHTGDKQWTSTRNFSTASWVR